MCSLSPLESTEGNMPISESQMRVRTLGITLAILAAFMVFMFLLRSTIMAFISGAFLLVAVVLTVGDLVMMWLLTRRLHTTGRVRQWFRYCYRGTGITLVELARRYKDAGGGGTRLYQLIQIAFEPGMRTSPSSTMLTEDTRALAEEFRRQRKTAESLKAAERQIALQAKRRDAFERALMKQAGKVNRRHLVHLLPVDLRWETQGELDAILDQQDHAFLARFQEAVQEAVSLQSVWRQAQKLGIEIRFLELVREGQVQEAREYVVAQRRSANIVAEARALGCKVPLTADEVAIVEMAAAARKRQARQVDLDLLKQLLATCDEEVFGPKLRSLRKKVNRTSDREWRMAVHALSRDMSG